MFRMKPFFLLLLVGLSMFGLMTATVLLLRGDHEAHAFTKAFAPSRSYNVGNNPYGMVVGNFMGQGHQDLAVTNEVSNTVSILANNGSGSFTAQPPIAVSNNPVGIVVGDFTGQGHQDLAIANIGNSTVSVLLNNGRGTFTIEPPVLVGTNPIGITVGNFMGHGYQDLAVTNEVSNTVSILANNGSGSFTVQSPIAVGHSPIGIVTGNFMGLGRADLAVTNSDHSSNSISILSNNGSGTFIVQSPIAVGSNPQQLVVGNFMGQGHQDLAVTNANSNSANVLSNNGSGSFTVEPPIIVGNYPFGITTGDFTGLGHADLAVTNLSDSTINTLSNNGSGTFTVQAPISVGVGPRGIVAGNFSGQGTTQEIANTNFGANTVSVLLNPSTVTPTPIPTSVPTSTPTPIPTSVPTSTPTPISVQLPDVAIQATHSAGNIFYIGQTVTETLTVSATSASTPIFPSNAIRANEVIPVGISNVSIVAKDWSILTTNTTSPLFISAVYVGAAVIGPGSNLPPINITGIVNADANSTLIDAGSVGISGDRNPNNNLVTDILFISSAPYTPTPPILMTPSPTATPGPVVLYTPVPLPSDLPDLSIMQVAPCTNVTIPRVGSTVSLSLIASNASLTIPIDQTIHIAGMIPAGASNIKITGVNWDFTLSSSVSPMVFSAVYTSLYLLAPAASLPPITFEATFTTAAMPAVTDYFESSIIGDSNPNNNYVTITAPVLPALTSNVSSQFGLVSLRAPYELIGEERRWIK